MEPLFGIWYDVDHKQEGALVRASLQSTCPCFWRTQKKEGTVYYCWKHQRSEERISVLTKDRWLTCWWSWWWCSGNYPRRAHILPPTMVRNHTHHSCARTDHILITRSRSVWTNRDMDPTPLEDQTWTIWSIMAYWATDTINLGTWETASSILSVGLSWREAIPCM